MRRFLGNHIAVFIDGRVHRVLALRIAGTGQKLTETPFLDDHVFSALVAFNLGGLGFHMLDLSIFIMGEIPSVLAIGIF